MISDDLRVISDVFMKLTQEKNREKNKIDHERLCETEFTLVSLYSTEITRYRSWFLEYKRTWVNSVQHWRTWCILYIIWATWSVPCNWFCFLLGKGQNPTHERATHTHNHSHDDVIKWEYFPRYWRFLRWVHWSPVDSPHKGQWCFY